LKSPVPTLLIANHLPDALIQGRDASTIQTSTPPRLISGSCTPGLRKHFGQAHRNGTSAGTAEYPPKCPISPYPYGQRSRRFSCFEPDLRRSDQSDDAIAVLGAAGIFQTRKQSDTLTIGECNGCIKCGHQQQYTRHLQMHPVRTIKKNEAGSNKGKQEQEYRRQRICPPSPLTKSLQVHSSILTCGGS